MSSDHIFEHTILYSLLPHNICGVFKPFNMLKGNLICGTRQGPGVQADLASKLQSLEFNIRKKFKELLPVLSSRHLSFKTRGHVYSSCVRSAMLHASETWPLTKQNLQRLQRNDRAMIRQICNVKPQDTATIRSHELRAQLCIEDLDLILKERRLRWYGHVQRSNGAIKSAYDIQVEGKRRLGRPKMTWKQLTERDRTEWKLSAVDPHDRDTWRYGVRSAMLAASQLPGRGPTEVDIVPEPAR